MKILYGVAGEGFGHSSRALSIASHLEKKGHKIIIMTHGQAYKVLKGRFKTFKVKGLHLIFRRHVLHKRKTVAYNLKHFTKNFVRWKKFHKLMKDFKPNLCISDMEPIVPILSSWYKKPLVSIDNQHRLTNLEINVPKKYQKDFIIAREVTNTFIRRAEKFIVVSFSKSKIKKKDTILVPPLIRPQVTKIKGKTKYKKKILVYLGKKNAHVLRVLKRIPEEFIIYGYNKKKKKANLQFKTKETFLKDLKECKAVIATSGFTLMSEAIFLDKPYLALPLKGQFEQVLNSLFLKKAEFGDYFEKLTEKDVIYFLYNLEKYKKNLKDYNPNHNRLFKVLDETLKSFK